MNKPTPQASAAVSSISLLDHAASGATVPPPEPMPTPDHRLKLPMRDGVQLDTSIWLPPKQLAVPAILLRTPYKESVMGFKRLGVLAYVEAGYAVVIQLLRGIGDSEGHFSFNAPHERSDGYDTVEWIASQPWCTGAVGMDGSSYVAMTQLAAASECPPHLLCVVPAVPSLNFFREIPYAGGAFGRQHTLNWTRLLQIDSLNEAKGGFTGVLPLLRQADVLERVMMRPLSEAAEGSLEGDFLRHYEDVLAHPTFDDWWQARTLSAGDLGRISIPTLVVNGNFDLGIGAMSLWHGLEANSPGAAQRRLLIGPWDHGQCYAGGQPSCGPYEMGPNSVLDLAALRLAFFDQHLKKQGPSLDAALGLEAEQRVRIFITGSNEWRSFDSFPPPAVSLRPFFLSSQGHANSWRGDGQLLAEAPHTAQPPDHFIDDPRLPFIAAMSAAREGNVAFDLRERERHHETLVYDSGPLHAALTLLGEGDAELFVAVDAPDADVALWLAEHRADGSTVKLASGQLRLRYHAGFDAERLLEPGVPVQIRIPLTYIAHRVPAGSHLRLLIAGSNFPWADPNPHTGEPVATAVEMRSAVQTVFHEPGRASVLRLPIYENGADKP